MEEVLLYWDGVKERCEKTERTGCTQVGVYDEEQLSDVTVACAKHNHVMLEFGHEYKYVSRT